MKEDPSLGWNAIADQFIAHRSDSGADVIRRWAAMLAPKSAVLDVGCGHGVPVAQTLIDSGHNLFAIDAAPAMVCAFKARFPRIQVRCEAVETSTFFDRHFDGVVAIGLLFLFPGSDQPDLITKLGSGLHAGGRLIFSAPRQVGTWQDTLTGQTSYSLGYENYLIAIKKAGLFATDCWYDDGETHYYLCKKR
jgi:SAM-dependent methyltransferase